MNGYECMRKDRAETVNKSDGGLLLYIRDTVKCVRRSELEILKLKTICAEIEFPHSKPVLIYTVYRPPNVNKSCRRTACSTASDLCQT